MCPHRVHQGVKSQTYTLAESDILLTMVYAFTRRELHPPLLCKYYSFQKDPPSPPFYSYVAFKYLFISLLVEKGVGTGGVTLSSPPSPPPNFLLKSVLIRALNISFKDDIPLFSPSVFLHDFR
jgi:hypothetical protein